MSAAASIAIHLSHHGYTVRLVTASGDSRETEWHSHSAEASTIPLLEALAVVQLDHAIAPDTQWLAEPGHGGLTIGVFGGLGEVDLPFLRRLQHHASSSLAIALDVDAWAPHLPVQPGLGASSHLTSSGWRSVTLGPRDRLDTAWQELGLMQSRATAPAGVAR